MPQKHIAIVTDAWDPQTNGVVRVLKDRKRVLEEMGYRVSMITAEDYHTVRFPPYPEVRLAVLEKNRTMTSPIRPSRSVGKKLTELKPDFIHIATVTEGTLGPAAAAFCRKNKISYTAEMHSQLPEYAGAYAAQFAEKVAGLPGRGAKFVGRHIRPHTITSPPAPPIEANEGTFVSKHIKPAITKTAYFLVRACHNGAIRTLVPSQSMADELKGHGLNNLVVCPHGVDTELFQPGESHVFDSYKQPIFLYVGRVAVEKGIDKFLALDLPGTKIIVGDGPERKALEKTFSAPNVKFLGKKVGKDLVAHYQGASVVVFPSVTDTFGNVNVEALACGKPVAAFPASGVKDIISKPGLGALNADLRTACMEALELSRKPETAAICRNEAVQNYKWEVAARSFLDNLVSVGSPNKARSQKNDAIWETVSRMPQNEVQDGQAVG